MDYKLNAIVLFVSQLSFDDDQKNHIEGTTVLIVNSETLEPYQDEGALSRGFTQKGYRPMKQFMTFEQADLFSVVPALYEITLEMRINAAGQSTNRVKTAKFLKKISVVPVDDKQLSVNVLSAPASEDKLFLKK